MNIQVRRGVLNATLAMAIPVIGISTTTSVSAEQSEIDVFDQALASGSKEGAVRFFEAFPSSHLGSDLIELLPPDVAAEVCGGLPSGASSATRHSCGQLSEAVARAPAAGSSEIGETIAQGPNAQPTEASPAARAVSVDADQSKDKPRWVTKSTTDESTTDASVNSRRDGIAANDTAKDTADNAPENTADTSTDTSNPAPADTAATADETAQTIPGSLGEDGGAVAAGPGGRGNDSGTGGSSGGGGAGGGGRR